MIDPQLRVQTRMMELQTKEKDNAKEKDEENEVAADDEQNEQQTDEDDAAQVPAVVDQQPETSHDIQILDLHSDKPYISYRGRVFEGEWAEVMGTELILAQHDQNDNLAVLRHLAHGVDLLAASSSRIITKERIPKLKETRDDDLAEIKHECNIKVPAGKDRSGERARQARFLENLMALKKKKGQEDQVTIYATNTAGQDFEDNKDPDQKPPKKSAVEKRGKRQPVQKTGAISSNPFAGRRQRGGERASRRGRGLIDSLSAVSRHTSDTLDEMYRNDPEGSTSDAQQLADDARIEDPDAMDMSHPV